MATLLQSFGRALSRLVVVLGWPVMRPVVRAATTVETLDAATDEPHRRMLVYLEEDHRWLVIARHGARTDFVREALAHDGRLKVLHHGMWQDAHLRLTEADPEVLIDQLPSRGRRDLRQTASEPRVAEIRFDAASA
ncbi:MAG: hypothetical protein IVW36_10810 [Dehalococcoidia bacterium]|nr:hypothetical protein [Dehalococcoidia bacterium]